MIYVIRSNCLEYLTVRDPACTVRNAALKTTLASSMGLEYRYIGSGFGGKPDRQMGIFHAIEPLQHGDLLLLALSLALAWSLLGPEHVLELRHLRRPVDKLAHPR